MNSFDDTAIRILAISGIALACICFVALSVKKRRPEHNRWAFGTMAVIIVVSSALLLGSVMDNFLQSTSRGIVRQSLEVEYWVCGVEVDLRNPTAPSQNSIGSGSYFEADDKVARFQGMTGREFESPNLASFQSSIGGLLTADEMIIPVSEKFVSDSSDGDSTDPLGVGRIERFLSRSNQSDGQVLQVTSGNTCGTTAAEVQYFVFRVNQDARTYTQEKVTFPSTIGFGENQTPYDCVIATFDTLSSRTDRLCASLGEVDAVRCQDFRTEKSNDSCEYREVPVQNGGQL